MKTKKKIIVFALLTICLTTLPISFALITKEIEVGNIITFGNIKMKVIQTTYEDNQEKEIKDQETFNITTNNNFNRNIKIENIGKNPMFVRVKINVSSKDKENNNINIDEYMIINQKDNNWIKKDNWYYYKKEIKPKETSKNLELDILFDINNITKNYKDIKIDYEVITEALQSENNSENVLEAVGWPSK